MTWPANCWKQPGFKQDTEVMTLQFRLDNRDLPSNTGPAGMALVPLPCTSPQRMMKRRFAKWSWTAPGRGYPGAGARLLMYPAGSGWGKHHHALPAGILLVQVWPMPMGRHPWTLACTQLRWTVLEHGVLAFGKGSDMFRTTVNVPTIGGECPPFDRPRGPSEFSGPCPGTLPLSCFIPQKGPGQAHFGVSPGHRSSQDFSLEFGPGPQMASGENWWYWWRLWRGVWIKIIWKGLEKSSISNLLSIPFFKRLVPMVAHRTQDPFDPEDIKKIDGQNQQNQFQDEFRKIGTPNWHFDWHLLYGTIFHQLGQFLICMPYNVGPPSYKLVYKPQ